MTLAELQEMMDGLEACVAFGHHWRLQKEHPAGFSTIQSWQRTVRVRGTTRYVGDVLVVRQVCDRCKATKPTYHDIQGNYLVLPKGVITYPGNARTELLARHNATSMQEVKAKLRQQWAHDHFDLGSWEEAA